MTEEAVTKASARYEASIAGQKKADETYAIAAEPVDHFADAIAFFEENGVMRMVFRCSRPETEHFLGGTFVPVARISMPAVTFRLAWDKWSDGDDKP